jgi:WD40 repeat protein
MPDGRHAISSSNDTTLNATTLNATTLKVWDLGSGRLIRTLSGHGGPVHGVAVTPNGRWAVSASDDHTLRVWDLESTRVLATFTCDGQAVCCACASDTQFVAGDAGGHVLFLELMLPKDH